MRRRTRRKFTWFPNIGTPAGVQTVTDIPGRVFLVNVLANGDVETQISPLLPDTPADPGELSATAPGVLPQFLAGEYIIERIVGKMFAGLNYRRNAGNDPSVAEGALFAAGIFVARANDANSGGGNQFPIGSATPLERNENYGPLNLETIREPFMWRRVWAFGNRAFYDIAQAVNVVAFNTTTAANPEGLFPPNTMSYGSVMDGPHVDVKSVRRVRGDERLWLSVSACRFPRATEVDVNNPGFVTGYFDYRVLGALRRAKARSNF